MKKRIIVLSLGGSLIIPDSVNLKYLKEFKKVILKNSKKYKFVVVCGGGSLARKYISALENKSFKFKSLAGIAATRINARFMNYFFDIEPVYGIPHTFRTLKKYLRKKGIVFCGALEYKSEQTSDSTSAEIARKFKCDFINLTDVSGLYDKNPKKFKNAKFISSISWKEFYKMANAIKFKPGQHFVLDQTASKIIMEGKVRTYIVGKNVVQLDNLLNGKKFKGTSVFG